MPSRSQLSNREARWLALQAQGLGRPRPAPSAPPGTSRLRKLLDRVGTIQLDAVNIVARTQFLVPWSRIGHYEPADLRALSHPGGDWFEYWGHAASLLPLKLQPLFRWRMQRWRDDLVDGAAVQQRRRDWRAAHAGYLAAVLSEIAERGPLAASQLSDPRRRAGEWWDRRSDGRRALELLFGDGALAAWRSPTFERVYDLTERVIPRRILDLPTPSDHNAQRELLVLAARSLGVATTADLADYFWLRPGTAQPRLAELVEDGRLVQVMVEGWPQPAYTVPGTRISTPSRQHATLLSPFDSLIWARERTQRLFGFHYRIEIYVPAPRRLHGYYVMPLLHGDELVARLDLKSDRRAGALVVAGAYAEPGHGHGATAEAALAELHRLRDWLGLAHVLVTDRGDFAPALQAAAP